MFKLSITRCMVLTSGYSIANWHRTCANANPERYAVGNVKWRPPFGSTAQNIGGAAPFVFVIPSRFSSRHGCREGTQHAALPASHPDRPLVVVDRMAVHSLPYSS